MAAALVLVGCSEEPESGLIRPVEGFAGVVASDAPNATVVGRDILGNNGTAGDAAVAMGLAMAVTMPSRVSLGGGGVCLIWSAPDRLAEALVFTPTRGADGAVAPMLARAMALLHARYGSLRWGELVAPAETFARFGFLASRAFVRDLEAGQSRIAGDPDMAALFRDEQGAWAREGRRLRNPELSTVLGGLRAQGGGYLHTPSLAERYAEAAAAGGMRIGPRSVRDARPEYLAPVTVSAGDAQLYLPPPRSSAGVAAGQMWQILVEAGWAGASEAQRSAMTAQAGLRALAAQRIWIGPDGLPVAPQDVLVSDESTRTMSEAPPPPPLTTEAAPYAAGFVVGDRRGTAIACSFTLNDLFGRGRLAPGMGIVLPAEPSLSAKNSVPLAVGMIASPGSGRLEVAGEAGGGEAAFQHLVQALLRARALGQGAEAAVAAPRLVWQGGALVADPQLDTSALAGAPVRQGPDLGHVNLIVCPEGLDRDSGERCSVSADPRGFGLAERAQ